MLTAARGRLNPLLPLQGLGKPGEEVGCERRPGQPPRGHLGLLPAGRRSSSHPTPNTLPVGPRLVGRGPQQRHSGGRSLHDLGWDGGIGCDFFFIRYQSSPGELWGRREVCHCLGAAGDAGSPPGASSPPPPGSASFRVGGRRRGGRTEHAQLGGRTAEELAASALRSASPGFRSRRARSPQARALGPARVRIRATEGAPPRTPLPAAGSAVRLDLSSGRRLCSLGRKSHLRRAWGRKRGDPPGETLVLQPARALLSLRGAGT